MAKRKSNSGRIDFSAILRAASGQWVSIAQSVGIRQEFLTGRHGPCPVCHGNNRWRVYEDFQETGGAICNQCGRKLGDGIKVVAWFLKLSPSQAAAKVAECLGMDIPRGSASAGAARKRPEDYLQFVPWNPLLASIWCKTKPPVKPDAIQAIGGRLARYRAEFTVIAIPVRGRNLSVDEPIGWVVMDAFGRRLPVWDQTGNVIDHTKIKTLPGSKPGLIGVIRDGQRVIKTEGPTDLLALISSVDTSDTVVCNVHGCQEDPCRTPWLSEFFSGKDVVVIHDADKPGQDGALEVNGRPGWAKFAAVTSATCRLVKLPYPIVEKHGKDLRDFFAEGRTAEDFERLVFESETVSGTGKISVALKNDDDPHRLARVNLERYATENEGRKLRYWRDEWYVYKGDRYQRITEKELRAKVSLSIEQEFDRINIGKQLEYEERKAAGLITEENDKGPPKAQKVSQALITNVLQATSGLTILSSSIETGMWIPDRSRRNYVAMQNGIIDMDAVVEDRDDYLLPHSPDWFSTVCLPYDFDPRATCPRWESFLERNLELDPERIKMLQEWAGYLLLPDTGQQKFMLLEGEGANGKSVFCAGIEAMIGANNVSHVPMEIFGEKFELTQTLDRLVNICGDAGELDKVAEGHIKAFTSGNAMSFGRKYLDSVERVPTARLMIAANNRPRLNDKSDGVWRRMLVVPWRIQIPVEERVLNMDKAWWWAQSGELPGIFLWAVKGLHRLRQQQRFTTSELCEAALADYRAEMNPARRFLAENLTEEIGSHLRCSTVYSAYSSWCKENGNHPLSEQLFGREVFRVFRKCTKRRADKSSGRFYFYDGISFSVEEICGMKTQDAKLF